MAWLLLPLLPPVSEELLISGICCTCQHSFSLICKLAVVAEFSSLLSFSSVTQLCLTLCDPMNYSTPCFPLHHHTLKNHPHPDKSEVFSLEEMTLSLSSKS